MKKFVRSIFVIVAIGSVTLVALIVANQFDEALNPELQNILAVDQKITPEQEVMYKEFLTTKPCTSDGLTPQLRQAIQKIINARGLIIPRPHLYGTGCLTQLLGEKGDAYFETWGQEFKLGKDQAIENMRNLLTAQANTVNGDNTLIIRMLALSGLAQNIERIEKFGRTSVVGFAGLARSLISPEVIALMNCDPHGLLEEAAGSELRMTNDLLLQARRDFAPLGEMSKTGEMSPPSVVTSRFLWLFYQHNRTMNRLYENWLIEKAADKACLETKNCPDTGSPVPYRLKDYFINPMGMQIVRAFSWRLGRSSEKILNKQVRMKKTWEQMEKAGPAK